MLKNITIAVFGILLFVCCKDNSINREKENIQKDSIKALQVIPDTLKKEEVSISNTKNSNQINLPFDFEEKNKLANTDRAKCAQLYPQLVEDKLNEIKKIISENTEDNPDEIFQINNGGLGFDSYVYCTYGDSDSQTLISIKDNKIIASESIGYAMPENKTFQSFVINEDLSITIYDVEYNTFVKKILEKYQIKNDGKIVKI
jgi:hypothetical protein